MDRLTELIINDMRPALGVTEPGAIAFAVAAAREQLAAIDRLRDAGRLDSLPDKLREAARLRIGNPELNLAQLGALCDPPVSKSAFNHRMRKLMELAGGA